MLSLIDRGDPTVMRVLISCPDCNRQYDASKCEVGARVHCHCGQVIVVQPPRGHEARVVRCSSCGAPREGNSSYCRFCRADFTLHEKDLHTVCPKCLTRVSDRAKFCHCCGIRLSAQMAAGDSTNLECPSCAEHHPLVSRQLGQGNTPVFECNCCGGLWLSLETLEQLTEKAVSEAVFDTLPDTKKRLPGPQRQLGSLYRPCAYCKSLMVRRNYGRRSGTIVDICRHHGVWFDNDELARVLTWIRNGGKTDRLIVRRSEDSEIANSKPIEWSGTGDEHDGLGKTAISSLFRIFDLF